MTLNSKHRLLMLSIVNSSVELPNPKSCFGMLVIQHGIREFMHNVELPLFPKVKATKRWAYRLKSRPNYVYQATGSSFNTPISYKPAY